MRSGSDRRPRDARRPGRWLVAPTALLLLAGCTTAGAAPDEDEQVASPFADCGSPVGAGGSAPSGTPSPAAVITQGEPQGLPDVALPCFTGGEPVRIADLRGPAVINLWGSWCGPCREELPVMQELADATAGRLLVLGVDTRDDRDSGASFAAEHGVRMPTLYDEKQKLLSGLGRNTLPLTVFLNAAGESFVYSGKALDKPTLGGLVRTHTGVTVTG